MRGDLTRRDLNSQRRELTPGNDKHDSPSRVDLPLFSKCEEDKKFRKYQGCFALHPICFVGAVFLALVGVKVFLFPTKIDYCDVALKAQQELSMLQSKQSRANIPEDWKAEIPKIIHHQWKDENIPPKYQPYYKAWFEHFPEPEYKHMIWTDETGRKLIQDHYSWFLDTYDSYDYNIKRVDVVRYFALYHYGGIHGDLDYEPLINFSKHIPQDRVSVVESPYQYYEFTQNSLMSSPKGDPFWKDVFSQLVKNKHMSVMEATGPKMLDTVMATAGHPAYVLPCENFQRIPLGETHLAPFLPRIHKELFARVYPMKQCGDFSDKTCQFARHHCSASYFEETGIWDLLFKK